MTLFTDETTTATSGCLIGSDFYKSLPFRKKLAIRKMRFRSKLVWAKFYWSNGHWWRAITWMVTTK